MWLESEMDRILPETSCGTYRSTREAPPETCGRSAPSIVHLPDLHRWRWHQVAFVYLALANPIFLESRKELGKLMPEFRQLFKQWEVPVLVLLSLTFQLILVLLSNRRRYTKSLLLNGFLWAAYMVADSVATLGLGVISTNLTVTEALSSTPLLDPRIELQAFWAPFFLLHLGGPDTITAFQMEDNELWRRHLLSLVVQTSLTLYILFRALTQSSLTALSAMMFAAGSIKYAERTWSLWSASYQKCRKKAENAFIRNPYYNLERDWVDDFDLMRGDTGAKLGRTAIEMFDDTEGMFADVFVNREKGYKRIVQYNSTPKVMRLIEIELKMMYDNLYTKARVILSSTGLALRFISLILTCITLILFSSSKKRTQHIRNLPEYPLTFVLLGVSISLELYAAMLWLTSYRTIFKHFQHSSALKSLASWLRGPDWSNSMGQFSTISYFLQEHLHSSMRRNKMSKHEHHREVPDALKQFIHEYLNEASKDGNDKYSQHPLLESRGRVPWNEYQHNDSLLNKLKLLQHNDTDLKKLSVVFEKEFGEMIVVLHFVTEICFYLDRQHVFDKDEGISRMSRVSKHLSRYLMHLFVDSSDLLPQRTPLSKTRFYEQFDQWESIRDDVAREEDAAKNDKEKRRAHKLRACQLFWSHGDEVPIYLLQVDGHNLLKVVRPEKPVEVDHHQLERRWKLLSAVWVELLVHAADQCKGKAHAQHLRQGGELLTHVWVLLGHLCFIDEALLPGDVRHKEEKNVLPRSWPLNILSFLRGPMRVRRSPWEKEAIPMTGFDLGRFVAV